MARARRPGNRFERGGTAADLAEITVDNYVRRYGMYLDHLQRAGDLKSEAGPAAQVIPELVGRYVAELESRVRSVTVWNYIYHLRRAAELLAPNLDFGWLRNIESDIAFTMQPRPKFGRFVLSDRLLEAGLALIVEAENAACTELQRAKRVRNGLMVAFLALCPIRAKNFVELNIGTTFRRIDDAWWVVLPPESTKARKGFEQRIPQLLIPYFDTYLERYRPLLMRAKRTNALWISSTLGRPMLATNIPTLLSKITRETVGVNVSTHLFRTAAASTAAAYLGDLPYVGSAILGHRDLRIAENQYNRTSSLRATDVYGSLIASIYENT